MPSASGNSTTVTPAIKEGRQSTAYVETDGGRYLWRDLVALRQAQARHGQIYRPV
jgi:hypothetical protein